MTRSILLLLLAPASLAAAGPLEEGKALLEQKKFAEAAEALEKAAEEDAKGTEPLRLLMEARYQLKQWEAFVEALVRLGKRGVAFDTEQPLAREVQEQLGMVNWSASDPQRVAVFGRLAREFPASPWRTGWLSICMASHARQKQFAEAETVEKELLAMTLDAAGHYRVARAYLEASWKPAQALERMERAVDLRAAMPLPDDPLAREQFMTESSVWRAYLAFAYGETGKGGAGNRFRDAEPDGVVFEDATARAGLAEARGGRVAVGDFDGDGWDDLSFGGAVWRNVRGKFEKAELGTATGSGSLWADADNDGDLDLWVFAKEPACRLFLNAAGKFAEAKGTGMEGALDSGPEGCGLGDGNSDGILDAYLAVYEGGDMGGGRQDRYFVSAGKGLWADALEAAGMGEEKSAPLCGRGVNWGDFDGDGDADVFVSNYRLQRNYLWRNEGRGKFTNAAPGLGVQGVGVETPDGGQKVVYYGHTIGSCWADLDNDLDLDLVSANLAHPRFIQFSNKTQVLMNGGAAAGWEFTDIFPTSGIPYEETHSDVSAADADNDGDLDLYFTSVYRERPSWLVRNDGKAHFESISWKSGTVVFNGWGHAWLDADNDGRLDLVVCAGGVVRFFRNTLDDGSSWLQVALKGRPCNATGVGARIRVQLGDFQQIREIAAGRGTTSQDSMRAHFGFGKRQGRAAVEVRWPCGRIQRVESVELNRLLVIEEETGK